MWRKWAPYLVVVAVRARFFFSPMAVDEGGYLAVARAWFRGSDLYGRVWVDRPQGLLVLYGVLDRVGLGSTFGIRLLGLAACAVSMWACGVAAGALFGDRSRLPVVWAAGIALSIPQIEGFSANAELLSCSVAAVGLALALRAAWNRDVPDTRLLFLAGLAAGAAVTVKQSGFDATVAAGVAVVWTAAVRKWGAKRHARAVAVAVAGAAVPVGAVLLHAALTGFGDWWWAVAGVRLELKSALAPADYDKLRETARIVLPIVGVAAVTAVALLARGWSRHRGALAVLAAWSLAALAAFWTGGLFHRHYWTILMYPLAVGTGAALSTLRGRTVVAVAVAVLAVPTVSTARGIVMDDAEVARDLHADSRLVRNEQAARWILANVPEDDSVWVMCASSSLYAESRRDPPVRYLWFAYYRAVPGAIREVLTLLNGDAAPEWIVQVQEPATCDPTGALGALVSSRYETVGGTPGWVIWRRSN
ncbi:MAG: hypothetical protein ACKO1X_04520 [Acidimicrobiales bacterium]